MPTRSSARDTSSEERASGEDATSEKPSTENNALAGEDEVDDSDEDKPKKGGNQGRRKIDIEFIEVRLIRFGYCYAHELLTALFCFRSG